MGFAKLKQYFSRGARHRELLLLLLGGLLAIGWMDALTVGSFQREQQYKQTLMAQQLQAQLHSSLQEHVTALVSLNVVYQNFVEINYYDFQQYGQSIASNLPAFRRLFHVDPRMTIQQVYPLTPENRSLLGLSLGSDESIAPLMISAQSSHSPATSPLLTFRGHSGSVLAVTPIYRNNQEFLGFAMGEISLEKIWLPLSRADFLKKYQVQLLDPLGHPFFPRFQPHRVKALNTRVPFKVIDKQWTLALQPSHSSFEALTFQRLSVWGTGLLVILLTILLISGSKRHKSALEEAQQQFETIFQASPDGIMLLDEKLGIRLANPQILRWSGLSETELREKQFFDLFTCQCPQLEKCRELSFLLCTSEQFDETLPEILETQTRNAEGGNTLTLRLNASRVGRNPSLNLKDGFICVLGDISTSKELDRVKETHVATLTHDLKTPLLAQEMVLESILSGSLGDITPAQEKLLRGASQSVRDLLEMVNSTLLFYKLESSRLALQKHPIPVPELLREVMQTLEPLAQERGLTLQLEASLELPAPWVDPVQIKRVFHNLISNAIIHAKKDSAIRVCVEPEDKDRLRVSVRNEGKPIPPEELPKIFEKYYSLSRKFKQIGTGLGLYICRRIVELHGGKIGAESSEEQGTVFFLTLPCPQQVQANPKN